MATYNFTGRDKEGSIRVEDPRRHELCMGCMNCCKYMAFQTFNPTKEQLHFYQTRGFEVVDEGRGWKALKFMAPCPHLDAEQGCLIYENRPQLCRDFDGRNTNTLKGECAWETL